MHGTLATMTMFKKYFFYCFALIFISCVHEIETEDIMLKNGLYTNRIDETLLNGTYKSISPIGGSYSGNHINTKNYSKGIPTKNWSYEFNGDIIHSGEYLTNTILQTEITKASKALRTDLNLWQEGNYQMLNIELIQPQNFSQKTLQNVISKTKQQLIDNRDLKTIYIYFIDDSSKYELLKHSIQ